MKNKFLIKLLAKEIQFLFSTIMELECENDLVKNVSRSGIDLAQVLLEDISDKLLVSLICDKCKNTFNSNIDHKQDEQKICPSCYF